MVDTGDRRTDATQAAKHDEVGRNGPDRAAAGRVGGECVVGGGRQMSPNHSSRSASGRLVYELGDAVVTVACLIRMRDRATPRCVVDVVV